MNNNETRQYILPQSFFDFSKRCSSILLSNIGFLLFFLLACSVVITENEVIGAAVFVVIVSAALIICDDIMATTLPFLLLCVFVTRCYDSFSIFIKFAPLALLLIFGIVFHFVVFRQRISIGKTFLGLVAVSIALLLGGFGFISPENYFKGSSLYYTFFLGIGMAVFYLLYKSQLRLQRKYDVKRKLLSILYITGFFACVVTLFIQYLAQKNSYNLDNNIFQPGNNLSTFLFFALPCPFFFAERNRLHILSIIFFHICIFLTGSRGGMLMGSILMLLCLITFSICSKYNRYIYCAMIVIIIIFLILSGETILKNITEYSISDFFNIADPRIAMMKRGFKNFSSYPVFGHGLGHTGNLDIYSPVKGAMEWYHMMIPQIVASLGIVGILAYGYQFYLRIKTAITAIKSEKGRKRGAAITLILSYVGVLLMSQVNPGLFCPLPYSLMAVMIFAILDDDLDYKSIISKIKKS